MLHNDKPYSNIEEWTGAVVTTSGVAYASGDLIGANIPIAFTDPNPGLKHTTGRVRSVTICDRDLQAATCDVVFFNQSPVGASTFTNNSALSLAVEDLEKVAGVAHVGDHCALTTGYGVSQGACDVPFALQSAQTALQALLISRGTPTYTSTRSLLIKLGVSID